MTTQPLLLKKRQVLCVEDHPGSVSATLDAIREPGHFVELVEDTQVATSRLREEDYDLILLDLRLPVAGLHDDWGGLTLAHELLEGRAGPRNQNTLVAIITAFPNQIPDHRLPVAPHFLGVFPKLGSPLVEMRLCANGALDWTAIADAPGDETAEVWFSRDILTIEGFPDRGERVEVKLNCWPEADNFLMSVSKLPEELQQELAFGYRPVRLWALVNMEAASPEQLMPHAFELIAPDEDSDEEDDLEA